MVVYCICIVYSFIGYVGIYGFIFDYSDNVVVVIGKILGYCYVKIGWNWGRSMGCFEGIIFVFGLFCEIWKFIILLYCFDFIFVFCNDFVWIVLVFYILD